MAISEILKFASTASGADILSQAAYLSDPDRLIGHNNIARRALENKVCKQEAAFAAGFGQWLADNQHIDITDGLSPADLSTRIATAAIAISGGGGLAAQPNWFASSGTSRIINKPSLYNPQGVVLGSGAASVHSNSMVRTAGGKILSVGGATVVADQNNFVYSYNPVTNLWTARANYPLPIAHVGLVTIADGRIIGIHGRFQNVNPLYTTAVYAYDEVLNTWTSIVTSGAAPAGRAEHSCVVLPDNSILMIGGLSGILDGRCYKLVITGNSGVWTEVATHPVPSSARGYASAALVDENTVVYFDSGNVYSYSISGNTWTDRGAHGIPYTLFSGCVSVGGGQVFLTGQVPNVYSNSYIYKYPENIMLPSYNMVGGNRRLFGIAEYNNKVIVYGGLLGDNVTISASVNMY